MTKNIDITNSKMKEPDFKKFDPLSKRIKKTLDKVNKEESAISLSSLDKKFLEKLDQSGMTELDKISTSIEKRVSNKRSGFFSRFGSNARFVEFAIAGSLFLLLIGSGVVAYLWPEGDSSNGSDEMTAQFASDSTTQAVLMSPEKMTQSGYVAQDSAFVFDLASEPVDDPGEFMSISPEVEMEYSIEEEDGRAVLTARPVDDLDRDQNYLISMATGAQFEDGSLDRGLNWSVAVEPLFRLLSTNPTDGAKKVPVDSPVQLLFNHKNLILESIKDLVIFEPPVPGEFSIDGRSIIFVPTPSFKENTQYKVTVSGNLRNGSGEKIQEGSVFSFTTGNEKNALEIESEQPFWLDFGGREIVSFSGGIITSAYTGESEEVEYTLYSVPIGTLNDTVELFMEEGDKELPPRAEEIDQTYIDGSGTYEYIPDEDGLYILVARGELGSLSRLIMVSDLSAIALDRQGSFRGWLFDMAENEQITEYEVEVYEDGELIDQGSVDQEGKFKSDVGDYLVLKNNEEQTLWVREWSVADLSSDVENIFRPGIDSFSTPATLLTDQVFYKDGDTVEYFSDLRDLRRGSVFPEEYDQVNVQVYPGKDSTQLLSSESVDISKTNRVLNGEFRIPDKFEHDSLLIVVTADGKILARAYLTISNNENPDWNVKISTADQNFIKGESVVADISSNRPGQAFLVSVYADHFDQNLLDSSYHFEKLYWGADSLVYQDKVRTDDNGDAAFFYTPLESSDLSNFHSYTMIVSPIEKEFVPLASTTFAYSEVPYDLEVEYSNKGFISSGTEVPFKIISVDPWSRKPLPFATFDLSMMQENYQSRKIAEIENQFLEENTPFYLVSRAPENLASEEELSTNNQSEFEQSFLLPDPGLYSVKMNADNSGQVYRDLVEITDADLFSDHPLAKKNVNIALSDRAVQSGDMFDLLITSTTDLNGIYLLYGNQLYDSEILSLKSGKVIEKNIEVEERKGEYLTVCYLGIVEGESTSGWTGDCSKVEVQ